MSGKTNLNPKPPAKKRKQAEAVPRPSCDGLERRVAERTAELSMRITELTQERLHLRTLIDSLPDYIFIKDRQSRFLINNLAHAQVLGATHPDEVAGKTDLDIFPPKLAKQYFADEQALMAAGRTLNREETVVDPKSGETHWLQTTKVPLRDKDGKVVGLMGISRNITERKLAEEALQAARKGLEQRVAERTAELAQERLLLRTLIDNLPDGVYTKDTAGRKTLANPADLKNLHCQTEAEALGKSDFDLFPKDMAEKFWADDQQVFQGKPVLKREEFILDEDGQKRWLLTSKLPLRDQKGTIIGLVGIGRDITERKHAEEALRQAHDELEQRVAGRTAELSKRNAELAQERLYLRTLIDSLPDYIFIKDRQSRFLINNLAHAQVLGATCPDEVAGKTDLDIFPPELAKQYYADEQAVMKSSQPLNREETVVDPKSGETRWLLTTKVPLRDKDGKVVGLVGISRNISDLKLAEQALAQTHKQLLETSRMAGMAEVATGVLHNVGNVLNSVNVSASLISERLRESKATGVAKVAKLLREHSSDMNHFLAQDERGHQVPMYLEQLAEHLDRERNEVRDELNNLSLNIEHIKEIVATQQSYARVSGVTEKLVLSDLVEDALKIHLNAFERHGVKLVREFDPLPEITVDKHKVMQIVVNLLSNAKYACDEGGKKEKQVIVRLKPAGADRVKIEVADNGVGIVTKNLTRVFAQGFTTRKGGHGFGLHSGALAARDMGGALSVHSYGPGRGATFTLELPVLPPHESEKTKDEP
jgi:PAS domain S-box-containing protein